MKYNNKAIKDICDVVSSSKDEVLEDPEEMIRTSVYIKRGTRELIKKHRLNVSKLLEDAVRELS